MKARQSQVAEGMRIEESKGGMRGKGGQGVGRERGEKLVGYTRRENPHHPAILSPSSCPCPLTFILDETESQASLGVGAQLWSTGGGVPGFQPRAI